jgi:hypothetical protein
MACSCEFPGAADCLLVGMDELFAVFCAAVPVEAALRKSPVELLLY